MADQQRYRVVPRTLTFLRRGEQWLLIRRAADRRLWPGLYNGIGGHVEPGETIYESAQREIWEETGLWIPRLTLRGIVHIAGPQGSPQASPGVLIALFTGQAPSRQVRPSSEGELAWYPLDALPTHELVEDLPVLLPRLLAQPMGSLLYGSYTVDAAGEMTFRLESAPS